ncbi:aminodeoxychorismate lyase [Rhodococcus sp. D2-41]|uniref:Aminodeoxychorismate lyase n=1 Tax=Speluncibacter jeojiensis TaxID=2710754 RepID=A0A9X4M4F1_9ACTN|nr:aminodeoxychorismate lyase [Rhodococcus sp. D2-41]MDG3011595.1 aminodeoxychorismate lyase [Rhodococcus sp. D2-41]MDG3015048.1 aminodeoxychorismate lyase [Corynebacteriales bacterium D3-21]
MPVDGAAAARVVLTLDGELHDPNQPLLHADDLAAVRGDGAFETLLVRKGRACVVEDHLARLANSARLLDLPAPDLGEWRAAIEMAAQEWGTAQEGVLRLVLTRGREQGGAPTAYLTVSPMSDRVDRVRREGVSAITLERGFSIDLAATAPWQLLGAKTLSYATNMAALRYAHTQGADEVIFVSAEGNVLEGPRSSVVIWLDGTFITPPAEHGILAGTTQRGLFRVARERGIECAYRPVRPADLIAAEGVWMLSSATLVARVHTLNGLALATSPVDRDLHDMVEAAVQPISAG